MVDDDIPATFASPACFMHEIDPAYAGLPGPLDLQTWKDVHRWRKAERERLIAERLAMPAALRLAGDEAIATRLLDEIGDVAGRIVSGYWPFRGEPDLRPLLQAICARGGRTALPVVVEKGRPLEFHLWQAGEPLARGVWNIPVPAVHRPCRPAIVIAPVVGFDQAGYRLGYGGGFFDRTLAALRPCPFVIGVGWAAAKLATIYPQLHDIPMDMIILETGVIRARPAGG
ncbi:MULTISPECIES: 5-formyltetrahydrofolate cyclo-ligase [unclassified Rhizobium]|uniref:5-formyltetrahydrofolate cyclo-ligase n=1 Tax=unclassified Rhizobium TaxID=2613769 RepID=UPI0006F5CB2F|nr:MULTISPECIES: 5-formyltetrahydrofolate cyclo-ligase [unclassified Rhizobium]KQV39945.1 5-formyltetrahydrofolate cyclo-ligase [Rhizobium sp. Root1212]KRD31655.1 5-formyltetrahydrofolate cyclo-ligase [Rhizobium sp. Root268]